MPFMMMWLPYHYWKAMFVWQKEIVGLMSSARPKQREQEAKPGARQASPFIAPADDLVVKVSEMEAKDAHTGQSRERLLKPLTPRTRLSPKKSKERQREGRKRQGQTLVKRKIVK